MQITLTRPDGIHILSTASLQEMATDPILSIFGEGLLGQALNEANLNLAVASLPLAAALHDVEGSCAALLTALLVLDAEIKAVIEDESRIFPLAAFLSYRSNLPLDRYPLNMVRLPPLNHGGHYVFSKMAAGHYFVVRLDLHPELGVSGHVRVAVGGSGRLPQRLLGIEHRLERQKLDESLIEAALAGETSPPLSTIERTTLAEILRGLIAEK